MLINSENYCSYCDGYQDNNGNLLIEHYKGRTKFPEFETEYSNLYAACFSCNNRKRDENYPKNEPLRPDHKDYEFNDHFYFDPENAEIIPLNSRAKVTIEVIFQIE